jgi:hypothetical protein
MTDVLLDDWHDADEDSIARAAERFADSLTIGLAHERPPARLAPLVSALTLTLAAFPTREREFVPVPDVREASRVLCAAIRHRPRASAVLDRVLRQTEQLTVPAGLAAEAAAYSMLLGGWEFADWLARRPPVRAAAPDRPPVRADRDGDRLLLVLDDPERRNAFSAATRAALCEALDVAVLDDTVARVELSGAGPAFCAGGDLAEFGIATDLVAAYLTRLEQAPWRLVDRVREKVTVRVHGAAVGATGATGTTGGPSGSPVSAIAPDAAHPSHAQSGVDTRPARARTTTVGGRR